jgi:hypothetical protein
MLEHFVEFEDRLDAPAVLQLLVTLLFGKSTGC